MNASRMVRIAGTVVVAAALLATSGCVRVELEDPGYQTASERVQAEGATTVKATINMGAGVLEISGGATGVMDGEFEYSDESWKPEVTYEVADGEGVLSVTSPDRIDFTPFRRNTRYQWDVTLGNGLPLDLAVNVGAGLARLDLRGLDLQELTLNLGAGDTTIDLSGEWDHDVTGDIQAGAGALTLKVPADVGVRIVGYQDGLGSYRADGFAQDGDALVNDAWETADVRFDLVLRRGLGDVTIETIE